MVAYGFYMPNPPDPREPVPVSDLNVVLCTHPTKSNILATFAPGPIGYGHAVVMVALDRSSSVTEQTLVRYMDPSLGQYDQDTYHDLKYGNAGLAGPWQAWQQVWGINCPYTGIEDIRDFSHAGNNGTDVILSITFAPGTDPNEWGQLYVSDSELGPRLWVDTWQPLTEVPQQDITVQYVDTHRLNATAGYYYFIRYGNDPETLPNRNNPIFVSGTSPRAVLGPRLMY